jgi:hypothetical protein
MRDVFHFLVVTRPTVADKTSDGAPSVTLDMCLVLNLAPVKETKTGPCQQVG